MNVLKITGLKGTKEILKTLEDSGYTWTELINNCKDVVSLRIFNTRLRQLEDMNFIETKAVMRNKKAVKIYLLTREGKKLLELIREIEKLNSV